MIYPICVQCGVQFSESEAPPPACAVCEDSRNYVNWRGQRWTTMEALGRDHRSLLRAVEPGLTGLSTVPEFAIGQRALLVETPEGNVLWDCVSLVDDEAVRAVRQRGGLAAIAVSHPHFYGSVVEWSRAFGGAPVYLHASDREWVMRPDPCIVHWEGDRLDLPGGITAVRCGGHFAGGTVLHWPAGASGLGVLLTGDIVHVVHDRRYVSFMYSFPNLIPLRADAVRAIEEALRPFEFERIYGAWWERDILAGARDALSRSAARYIAAVAGP